MKLSTGIIVCVLFFTRMGMAQQRSYPQNYFRQPLNIPMQLVANFGEIRTNHWHMGLDIRTQQKVNLPVYASAGGFIARVSVEAGGFGQAIYIQHPNGFTTVYGHLNTFYPALAQFVKAQQYAKESWEVNLILSPDQFPVTKGMFIARSGSTGASEGPHVHFEIRDAQTENCLNPLLFKFPIADGVPPTLSRLVMYDRNKSTYVQTPQVLALKKSGTGYVLAGQSIRVGSNRISFAMGATDRLTGSYNPNGIFSASVSVDGVLQSGFVLDDISYNDTRYLNAQLDYPYKARGMLVQHITPLPGAREVAYHFSSEDGVIHLQDSEPHNVMIEVKDASNNTSRISFTAQYDASLSISYRPVSEEKFIPNHINVFERENFELFTTELSIYDTVPINFKNDINDVENSASLLFSFLNPTIPVHDQLTVRIRPSVSIDEIQKQRIVIKNISGTRTFIKKASWQNGWVSAPFRQFGTFQAFVDDEPPVINQPPANLTRATRIVFTPTDNFKIIKNFRAEIDGKWLRFSNDKGKSWVYSFDEHFPRGEHELKVHIEDEAGNVTERSWVVKR